jgi:two-component system CheB/CheR fusion protein
VADVPLANRTPPNEILHEDDGKSDQFLITALGAPAGGLEALEKFFGNMPPDAGIAFIVVQHLSPDHERSMSVLLAGYTRMGVQQARDETQVVANCIYVIPPNATLAIKDRILRVAPPVEARGRGTPIEHTPLSSSKTARNRGELVVWARAIAISK